jgi:hypothetical protein
VFSILALTTSCRGKPQHRDPPKNVETAAGSGSGKVPKAAPDIVLPSGPGAPPVKTTQPIGGDKLEALSKLTFPSFQLELRWVTKANDAGAGVGIELRQKTEDHPLIWATVTITPCFDCLPMDLPKWQEKTEALKLFLLPSLKADPKTKFEVGQTSLHGQPMIYTFQSGLANADPTGKLSGGFTHAYILYYNDGVNQIRVVAEYKDDPATPETMEKLAPRADLENVAKAFVDVYTQAW